MSKRLITATLGTCLAMAFTSTAQARLDHGPVSSHYDQADPSYDSPAAKRTEHRRAGRHATSRRHARKYGSRVSRHARRHRQTRTALNTRAMTAERGGGTSRSCLKPEARALLGRIESHFGPVSIVSTCRPGAVIAGSGKPSKHRYGLAIDFSAGNRKGAIVQWLIANHHSGGTMTYSGMSHIHVDIGPRFVSLGASGRGGRHSRS